MGKTEIVTIDLAARDARFLRAAADVLKKYKITRRAALEEGRAVFDVSGGQQPYVVTVHPEWAADPACTCPDAAKRAKIFSGGYCKHIMAVLLSNDDLRGQLLEVFL
jgi:uncharacterized Zn finger protein